MSDPTPNKHRPPPTRPPAPAPRQVELSHDDSWEPPHKESNVRTWIVVLILCIGMMVGVLYQRGELFAPAKETSESTTDPITKKKKKKRKKRRKRAKKGRTVNLPQDDELWEDEDLPDDDRFHFGDVFAESDPEDGELEVLGIEEFIPPKRMWDPSGPYRPKSRWAAPGAASEGDAVEISMSAPESAPLTSTQIQRVLNERKLMSCYDDIAMKVPQMRGKVSLKVQIEGNGTPTRVTITRSELRSRMVEDCIVSKVRRMRFPNAKGGQRTRFSTDFAFD